MKVIGILILALFTFGCSSAVSPDGMTENRSGYPARPANIEKETVNTVSERQPSSSDSQETFDLRGCWLGSHGGHLKITNNAIYDLKSQNHAGYVIVDEVYPKEVLIESMPPFERSYLNKFIKIVFDNEGLIRIFSYETYDDYKNDDFFGFATFERGSCER